MRSSSDATRTPSLAFGGQAVIEGVMIRSRRHMVICMRKQNGEILTKTEEINSVSERHKILRLPFIRGVPALFETLYLGVKGLIFSANAVLEEEDEKFTYKEIALTMLLTLALTSFFIVVPFLLTTLLKLTGVIFNIVEAVVRLTIFLVYLKLISLWSELKRVFQYHGAEHKAINAYEAGVDLDFASAREFSRLHPRCGTSFLFIVLLVSILLFSVMPDLGFFARLAYRVILIPVLGAVSYEILKFSDRRRNSRIMRILVAPGLAFQRLTTREPDDDMISVALEAVKTVIELGRKP
ncbi:MAG: DUF1385 domain-containing protein [Candidatus Bathyarchaeota archaeon]|nr:DUF1385 domain-containing protein [Candidatus Bathyarchaeota archaeon]